MTAALVGELDAVYRNWGKPEKAAEWERKRPVATEAALIRNARQLRKRLDDPILLASHGHLLFQLQRFGEAEAAYRAASSVKPNDPWLRQSLGDACAAQRRFVEAEIAYRAAIRLEPNEGGRHHNLGDALRNQGKFSDAAVEYAEAIRLRPNEHASHFGLGSTYAYGGQWEKVAAEFQQAAQLNPTDLPILFKWATLSCYTNDQKNYQRACRALIEHFGKTDNIQIADCTTKACALAPGFGADPEQVMRLADATVFKTQAGPVREWFELARA